MIKLSKKQAGLYKKRWQQIESKQIQELQTVPMSLKFKQLCFLMNSFRIKGIDRDKENEIGAIRKRWVRLKSKMKK